MSSCYKSAEDFISSLTHVPVELLEPQKNLWVVVPKDRSMVKSKLWGVLRSGPFGGVGKTPLEAIILLARAAGVVETRRVSPRHRARSWLLQLLGDGSHQSVDFISLKARENNVPWSSVDRAARELCIQRKKSGFHGGWTWKLVLSNEG